MIGKAKVACISTSIVIFAGLSPVLADEPLADNQNTDTQSQAASESQKDAQASVAKDGPEKSGSDLPRPAEAKSDVKDKKKTPKTIAEAVKVINQKLNGIQKVAKQMEGECYRGNTAMNPGLEVTGGFGMVIPIGESAPGSQNYQPPRAKQIRQYAAHAELLVQDIQDVISSIVLPEDKATVLSPLLDQLKSSIAAIQQHQHNVSGNLNAMEIDRGVILSEARFFSGVTGRVREDSDKLNKAAASK